jgi:predicted Zn finger-like uncharacterized protein
MSAQKLTCPECSTVLRPAKPVAPGKKVRCPRCDNVFTARDDDEDDDAHEAPTMKPAARAKASSSRTGTSAKSSSKAGGGKTAAKSKKQEPPKDEKPKEEVYGVVKDEDEDMIEVDDGKGGKEKKRKPKIDYAPDTSIKDLRGPAVAMLVTPGNYLAGAGFIGAVGWLTLIVFLIIPAAFPLIPDKKEDVLQIDEALGAIYQIRMFGGVMMGGGNVQQGDAVKFQDEERGFFEVFGLDLWSMVGALPWYYFWPGLIPFVLMMLVSGLVAYGAIQMQNLESRRWGIAGSILAMLPMATGGIQIVTIMVAQFFLAMIIDDWDFIQIVAIIIASAEWVASVAIGIWALTKLLNEEVIAGFEYVAE